MAKSNRIPTEKELQKAREEGRTRGRKGYKALRINMAFTPEVHDYIKTMSMGMGKSITQFTEEVFRKSMEDNEKQYKRIKSFEMTAEDAIKRLRAMVSSFDDEKAVQIAVNAIKRQSQKENCDRIAKIMDDLDSLILGY